MLLCTSIRIYRYLIGSLNAGYFCAIVRIKLSFLTKLIDCVFRHVTDCTFAYIFFKVYTANKGKADRRQKARL